LSPANATSAAILSVSRVNPRCTPRWELLRLLAGQSVQRDGDLHLHRFFVIGE
jgi:hypothetical protein